MRKVLEGIQFQRHLAAVWFQWHQRQFTFGCGLQMSASMVPRATSQSGHSALHSDGLQNTSRPKTRGARHWNAFPSSLLSSSQNLQLSVQLHPTDLLSGKMRGRHHPSPFSIFETTPGVPDVQTLPEGCWRRVWAH